MEFTVETVEGITIITPTVSHLDASNCQPFEQKITPILEEQDRVLIDLKNLEFVDSSGVGILLFCVRKVEECGGRLRMCTPSEAVTMAFSLVRMHRLVDISETRAGALMAFETEKKLREQQPD